MTTLNVQNDIRVQNGSDTIFFMDYSEQKIGIGTSNPSYKLDVDGIINASEFLIQGQTIESLFSWTKVNGGVFYNQGNVGIGLTNPAYDLEVLGTVNAQEYYINNKPLLTFIETASNWKDADDGKSIYFNDGDTKGNVGIGVSKNINERLVVAGGLNLGKSTQANPLAGTIEFDSEGWSCSRRRSIGVLV